MDPNFLEFEQPIAELEAKISELRLVGTDNNLNIADEIKNLREKSIKLTEKIYANLNSWQVSPQKHPQKPLQRFLQRFLPRVSAEGFCRGFCRGLLRRNLRRNPLQKPLRKYLILPITIMFFDVFCFPDFRAYCLK